MSEVDIHDRDIDELTTRELRMWIGKEVGVKEIFSTSGLTKEAINSVVAYLTGELPIPPYYLRTPSAKNKAELMEQLAMECSCFRWIEDYNGEVNPRAFNKRELKKIIEEMKRVGDQRHWT